MGISEGCEDAANDNDDGSANDENVSEEDVPRALFLNEFVFASTAATFVAADQKHHVEGE